MSPFISFLKSSIGKKIAMATTGLALIGFLITHLIGNLLIFKSGDAYNHYSHALISNPLILVAEIILILLFVGHLTSGIRLVINNRRARPVRYGLKRGANHTSRKSLASTTMILSGLLILVFVPLHLACFKYGPVYPSLTNPEIRDIYRVVIEEFSELEEVVFYSVVMLAIGFHLWHAFTSAFESLGFAHRPGVRRAGHVLAILIAGGFAAIPLIVYFLGDHL